MGSTPIGQEQNKPASRSNVLPSIGETPLEVTAYRPENVDEEVEKLRGTSAPHSFSMLKSNEKSDNSTSSNNTISGGENDIRPKTTTTTNNDESNTTNITENNNNNDNNDNSASSSVTFRPDNTNNAIPDNNREGFGTPGKRFRDHGGNISEWGGRVALGSRFVFEMPFHPDSIKTIPPYDGQQQRPEAPSSPDSNSDGSTSEEKKADFSKNPYTSTYRLSMTFVVEYQYWVYEIRFIFA